MSKRATTATRKASEPTTRRRSLSDIVSAILERRGQAQLKDIVADARVEWEKDGRTPAKHFAGMVYHAANDNHTRVEGDKAGLYRYKKPAPEKPTKPAKTPAPKKGRKAPPPSEEENEEEEEDEEEEEA